MGTGDDPTWLFPLGPLEKYHLQTQSASYTRGTESANYGGNRLNFTVQLRREFCNLVRHAQLCRDAQGGHFQHLCCIFYSPSLGHPVEENQFLAVIFFLNAAVGGGNGMHTCQTGPAKIAPLDRPVGLHQDKGRGVNSQFLATLFFRFFQIFFYILNFLQKF